MNFLFRPKTLIPLAVAVALVANAVPQAQGQPVPSSAAASALPANVVPGSPLAEVIKMLQAGVDVATIEGYVNNSQSLFNLDADQIIFLKDEGAPSELINAMLNRDKVLSAAGVAAQPPPAPIAPPDTSVAAGTPDTTMPPPDTAPPAEDVTVNYFYNTLTPYGSWVNVDGYGQCWRPTAVNYDAGWRPYCDRGHWVYTDCGWYWDSDYAWGSTFHYGRWFRNPRLGWCWYPDNVWAPSWVTWRSDNDYCGWAPLPPFAVFNPGVGFFYRGISVGLNFDFGLGSDCFVFVPPTHFCERHPRTFCVDSQQVTQIFHQTTVINNFNVNNKTIINRGFGVDRIASVTHRTIEPVHVSSLPNAGRQGWRGEGFQKTMQHTSVGNNNHTTAINNNNNSGRNFSASTGNTGNGQSSGGAGQVNNLKNKANPVVQYDSANRVTPGSQQGGSQTPNYSNQIQNRSPVNGVHSTGNNQGQSPTYAYQQQQQQKIQMQTRQYNNTYNPANNGPSQNPPNNWQQNRNYNTPVAGGVQQHGDEQLQQRPFVTQPQPPANANAEQKYSEATGRNYGQQPSGQAVQQGQAPPHYSGNGNNGGNTRGSGKQNQ